MPKFRNIRIKKPGGGFRMQRAQVLKSGKLKFVKNVRRGGRKKAPAKRRTTVRRPKTARKVRRTRKMAKKGNPNNKMPKIGASIQAFKGGQAVLAPVIESGLNERTTKGFASALRAKGNLDYAGSLAIEALNQTIDHKTAHATALSRGSITAWAAEAFAATRAYSMGKVPATGRNQGRAVNTSLSQTMRAYDPQAGKLDLANEDFRIYQALRVGGGIARRLSNMGPLRKLGRPLKKILSAFGGRL